MRITLTKDYRGSPSKLASYKFTVTKMWFFGDSYVEAIPIPKDGYFLEAFRYLDCTEDEPRFFTNLSGE